MDIAKMSDKKLVAELEGAELDYWVARALGYERVSQIPEELCGTTYHGECCGCINDWNPSDDWFQAGPIIFANRIGFYESSFWVKPGTPPTEDEQIWRAAIDGYPNYGSSFDNEFSGKTPLIAAMRAFVASKYGEYVEVEET